MGTVNISYGLAMDGLAPVAKPPRASENITSSATAASATIAPRNREVARIVPLDVDIAVKVNGVATASDTLVKAGATYEIGGFSGGEVISVIEV